MKVYLAGENGKKKILELYESISCIRRNTNPLQELCWPKTDRQTDRQTDTAMQVHLAGEFPCGGKQLLLELSKQREYESISCRRDERESITLLSDVSKQASKQASNARVFLAGSGYHKTDEFLTEAEEKMRVFLAGNGYHKTDEFQLRQRKR